MSQISSALVVAIIALYGTFINSIVSVILGFIANKNHRLLEEIKKDNTKQIFIHQLQFDKEFKIYKKLWKAVVELHGKLNKFRLIVDFNNNDIYESLRIACDNVIDITNKNKPFYSPEIYSILTELNIYIMLEFGELLSEKEYPSINSEQKYIYYKKRNETMDKYKILEDKIGEDIRKRIGIFNTNIY